MPYSVLVMFVFSYSLFKYFIKIIDVTSTSNMSEGSAIMFSIASFVTLLLICIAIAIFVKMKRQGKSLACVSITKTTEDNRSISLTENESYGVFKAANTSSGPVTNVSMTENESYGVFKSTNTSSGPVTNVSMTENESYGVFKATTTSSDPANV